MRRVRQDLVALGLAVMAALTASADTKVAIIAGAPGNDEMAQRFHEWSDRLGAVLVNDYGVPPEGINRYPESADSPPATRAGMAGLFEDLATELSETDRLLVVMLGHGSHQDVPKFIVDGPDVTASDLRGWLDGLPAKEQLLINTTSASGGFVGVLGAPGRVVCTSTEGPAERNAPEFPKHLIETLENDTGDADRNGSLSWGEWLNAAASATAAWFDQEGLILTEHALLDDSGDGVGSRLPVALGAEEDDGRIASQIFLGGHRVSAPDYNTAIEAVEAWKARKDEITPEAYWDRLEQLLLDAARLHPDGASSP